MKKFIVFIVTAIVLMLTASVSVSAQYAYPPQTNEQGQVVQPRQNLLTLPEYRDAQEKANKGRTYFFVGLGMQAVGAGLCCVPIMRHDVEYYCDGCMCETNTISSIGIACGVIGGISAITGSVMEVVGLCKWISGNATMRDLRIAYAISGNGLVVSF